MLKKVVLNIVSIFLLCSLCFTQVLVNFFHNHSSEISYSLTKDKASSVKKEAPKCKLCGLETTHELYSTDFFVFTTFTKPIAKHYLAFGESVKTLPILFLKGRAPPVSSLLS